MTPSERYQSLLPVSRYFPVAMPNRSVMENFTARCGACKDLIPDEQERGEIERVAAGFRYRCIGYCATCNQFSFSTGLVLISKHKPGWEIVGPPTDLILDPWTRQPYQPPTPAPAPSEEDEELMLEAVATMQDDEWSFSQTAIVVVLSVASVLCFYFGNQL